MRLTLKRILLGGLVLVVALVAFLVFGRGGNSMHLDVQVTGTTSGTQNEASGQFSGSGTGIANAPFGNVTLSGSGSVQTESSCVAFNASGELQTAVGKLQLELPKPGRACFTASSLNQAEGSGELQASAVVDAVGADGSLLGRHGNLKARGTFDSDTGSFTVRLTGSLTR